MIFNTVRLGDIATVTSSKRIFTHQYTPTGIPFYRQKEIIDKKNKLDITDPLFISEDTYYQIKNKFGVPQKGDLLITAVGVTLGIPYVVADEVFYFKDGNLIWLKDFDNDVNSKYIYYWITSDLGQKSMWSRIIGAAQPALTIDAIKQFEIQLPNIDIQNKIAEILSAYDDLIENNQKQIKLLEEAAQRLYKKWFVDLRFPGYETAPIIDGVPEGWEWKPILDNDVFNFVKSRALPFEGEKTYYATADVSGTNVVSLGEKITFENKPSRAAIQPIPFSVWFARMINSYKILNCFGTNEWMVDKAILSSGFAGFTSRPEYYGFVYQTIASEYFDEEKNRYATGATQVSLTNDGLAKIQVLIPKIKIISKYSERVYTIMYKEELLKNENIKLKEARDRLLPKLMNGEIEV